MSFGRMLIHKCEVLRHEEKKRGNFIKMKPVSVYPPGTRCRFVRKNATNTEANGRIKVSAYYILYLPKRVEVKNGDVIIWSLDPEARYTVQEPYAPSNRFHVVTLEKEGEV